MTANHELALDAREILCEALEIEAPAPAGMIGAMAAFPLPAHFPEDGDVRLFEEHRIEVPVTSWPVAAALGPDERPRSRLLRISAQAYNDHAQYERLADALRSMSAAPAQRSSGRIASAE
jgi:isopenicillin-N epimerase